jgi:hypothetical protein
MPPKLYNYVVRWGKWNDFEMRKACVRYYRSV